MSETTKFSIKKGDVVKIIAGKEKGKQGKVMKVITKTHRVVVEKLNLVKRHTKPTQRAPQGGIIEKESPLDLSNVQIYCTKCNKGVRTGRSLVKDKSVRVCKTCGSQFDK